MEGKPLQDNPQREPRAEYMTLEPSYHGENKPRVVLKIIAPPEGFEDYTRLESWESQMTVIWLLHTRLQELLPASDLIEFSFYLDHVIIPELVAEKKRLGDKAECYEPEWLVRFLNEKRIEIYKTSHLRKLWGGGYGRIMEIVNFLNWRIYHEFKPQLLPIGQYGFPYSMPSEKEGRTADGAIEAAV